MNYGFIAICVLMGISLLISANQHGKERPNENFWTSLLGNAITLLLILWALDFNT